MNTSRSRRRSSDISVKRQSSTKLDDLFKSPGLDFIGKKRKRHRTDDDSLSLQSVDINIQEPKKKRRSSLARVTSLANILSPIRPVKKVTHAFQRSFSLRNLVSPNSQKAQGTPYRKSNAPPTPGSTTPLPRRRLSTYWHETVNDSEIQKLNKAALDRQEAIYELYKGEEDLIEDLEMVKKTYHDSLKKLGLLSGQELDQIFGHIDLLVPLHQDLVEALREQRLPDGTTHSVGQTILQWVPKLEAYVSYCANQVYAKALLDVKKRDPSVDDFLQRCRDSPFSRRLDLWSFLDVPRSKLVKYPLLFRSIQKVTAIEDEDHFYLEKATQVVEKIIEKVDESTGRAKCDFTKSKLDFLDEKQRNSLISESSSIICDGILKTNRGVKLHVFLFEKILVLTRPATRGGILRYQVYRQPIPNNELVLDEGEGEAKMGSFKSAFSHSQTSKHAFKVSFLESHKGQSHTLIPNDEHDKRQWTQSIRSVLSAVPLSSSSASSSSSRGRREAGDGQEDPGTASPADLSGSSFDSTTSSVPETEFL